MRIRILATKNYKSLAPFQKDIYGRSPQINEIKSQYIIAQNKGREVWLAEFHPCPIHKRIILELLEDDTSILNTDK